MKIKPLESGGNAAGIAALTSGLCVGVSVNAGADAGRIRQHHKFIQRTLNSLLSHHILYAVQSFFCALPPTLVMRQL